MKTPVNAYTLKNHFAYSWWKYLLVIAAGIFLVDLLFTVTTPRIPEDKRVEFYVYGYMDQARVNAYMDKIHREELPDMEEMTSNTIITDANYGNMQLMTYIAVSEGDLYLLPRDEFLSYASSGAFLPLEDDAVLMDLFNAAGKDLRRGWRTVTDEDKSETHLYGIPADLLPGLSSVCATNDGFLAVLYANGNTENVLHFLRCLVRDTINGDENIPQPAEVSP